MDETPTITLSPAAAMPRRTVLGALMSAAMGQGATASAALPSLRADDLTQFRVALPADVRELAAGVRHAQVAIATPAGFDAEQRWPVLVVSATSDPGYQSSRRLMTAYRSSAARAGWMALAADPDVEVAQRDDSLALRYALTRAAMDAVEPLWRDAGRATFAFAGFSGGAKYAGWLAALFASRRVRVAGIFLSGVNEDPVASAAEKVGVLDEEFRSIPVWLTTITLAGRRQLSWPVEADAG